MNNDFLRREWGAISFLIVTALGLLVVPIGLNLNHRNFTAPSESLISTSPSPGASVSPGASASPGASPSAGASASPVASPAASASPAESPSPAATPVPSPSPS